MKQRLEPWTCCCCIGEGLVVLRCDMLLLLVSNPGSGAGTREKQALMLLIPPCPDARFESVGMLSSMSHSNVQLTYECHTKCQTLPEE